MSGEGGCHVVCGDFNTPPDYPAYQILTDGRLSEESREQLLRLDTQEDTHVRGLLITLLLLIELRPCVHELRRIQNVLKMCSDNKRRLWLLIKNTSEPQENCCTSVFF